MEITIICAAWIIGCLTIYASALPLCKESKVAVDICKMNVSAAAFVTTMWIFWKAFI